MGFPGGTSGKEHASMQETKEMWVWSLGQETPLEKGMAAHSRILNWRIPWTEEPGGLQSMGSQRVRHNWSDLAHMCIPHNNKRNISLGNNTNPRLIYSTQKILKCLKLHKTKMLRASRRNGQIHNHDGHFNVSLL